MNRVVKAQNASTHAFMSRGLQAATLSLIQPGRFAAVLSGSTLFYGWKSCIANSHGSSQSPHIWKDLSSSVEYDLRITQQMMWFDHKEMLILDMEISWPRDPGLDLALIARSERNSIAPQMTCIAHRTLSSLP